MLPVDAVEEFKVQQNTYSADIGFGGNTVINVVNQSDEPVPRQWYKFLQNSALNANNWFNNQNGVKISPRKQNQFGARVGGGPIRKDKTLFFIDYQRTIAQRCGTARAARKRVLGGVAGRSSVKSVLVCGSARSTRPADARPPAG